MIAIQPAKGQTWRRKIDGAQVEIIAADGGHVANGRVAWRDTSGKRSGRTLLDAFVRRYTPVLPINVGEVWQRRRDGRLVRVVELRNRSQSAIAPHLDVRWENVKGRSHGHRWCFENYWLRDYDRIDGGGES